MTQTITRLFDSYDTALRVALDLKDAGFGEREISLLTRPHVVQHYQDDPVAVAEDVGTGAGIGGAIGAATGLMAGLGVVSIPGIGPVVAAGWLVSTLAAGAAGAVAGGAAGGIIGVLANAGSAEDEAHVYAESVRRGASLVTVRVPDDRATEATRILADHRPVDPAARAAEYRITGWERFDEAGQPYLSDRGVVSAAGVRRPAD